MNISSLRPTAIQPGQEYVNFILAPDRPINTRKAANEAYYGFRVLGFYDNETDQTRHAVALKKAGFLAFNFIQTKTNVFMDVFSLLNPKPHQRVLADDRIAAMLPSTVNQDRLTKLGLAGPAVERSEVKTQSDALSNVESNVCQRQIDLDADPFRYAPPADAWPDGRDVRYALFTFMTPKEHPHRTPQICNNASIAIYAGFSTVSAANAHGDLLAASGWNSFTIPRHTMSQYDLLPWLPASFDPDGTKSQKYLSIILRTRFRAFNEANAGVAANAKEYKDPSSVAELKKSIETMRTNVHQELKHADLAPLKGSTIPMTIGKTEVVSREEYERRRKTGSVIDGLGYKG
jgi:hypothetical protein